MKNIGVFYNPLKLKDKNYLENCIAFLRKNNLEVILLESQKLSEFFDVKYVKNFSKNNIDILIIFGGDGTMLLAAKLVLEENIPILGFNFGKLGFLSECIKDEFQKTIKNIINKEISVEKRTVLTCYSESKKEKCFYAINDCVIYKSEYPKLINIDLFIDDNFVNCIRADGLIIATPTGSTAYSLSAGGSIISPECDVILITPINPQNPFTKPLVVKSNSELSFILRSDIKNVKLNIDGENIKNISKNEKIFVKKSKFTTNFLRLPNKNFFKILREKFILNNKI